MAEDAFPDEATIRERLAAGAAAPALRFVTCGSVDDGKSTLIGRLLFESGQIFEDQLAAVAKDSARFGTQGDRPDLALVVDGLQAEREQGITIDVAYRYFATPRRRFVVADCPGHEQYTRNMATGASTADAAVLLVDARKGPTTQTARHARIVAMMGVRHVALAVNKLDTLAYDQAAFDRTAAAFQAMAADLGFASVTAIPVSALEGDNVTAASAHTPWYAGPSLLGWLETVPAAEAPADQPFRMAVQRVSRPDPAFRGYAGRVAAGEARPGDAVVVLPSGTTARIARVVAFDGDREVARAGDAVTLTLDAERDVGRGDVLAAAAAPCGVADQFEAQLVWFHEAPLMPGRPYAIQLHACGASGTVTQLKARVDPASGARLAARTLAMNEIGVVAIALDRPVAFAPYAEDRALGAFTLIDRATGDTAGAGMIVHALRRSANVRWQPLAVDQAARAAALGQAPRCIWLTGLPGAGKSTIANLLEQRLHALGRHTYLLDGDNVRHGLNRDLGFTAADRVENVRRMAEVARLMVDAGLVVVVSAIAPFRAERAWARGRFPPDGFMEVFVDAPPDVCAARDPKGLWAKARRGELANFTGVDSPYEAPASPDVTVRTAEAPVEACVQAILDRLAASEPRP